MKTKLVSILIMAIAITSCKTVKSGTAKSRDIVGIGVIHKPVIADLDVNQKKVSKTIILKGLVSLETSKSEAIREILKENNADLFIEPKFETITKNGKTELTINGWLAFYKNFRTIEEKDIRLIEVNPFGVYKSENSQTVIISNKK